MNLDAFFKQVDIKTMVHIIIMFYEWENVSIVIFLKWDMNIVTFFMGFFMCYDAV